MTVASTYAPVAYAGNGGTRAFSFPYNFFSPADLTVTLFNTATEVSTTSTLNGGGSYDYTVAGSVDAGTGEYLGGGTVTLNTAPPGGTNVILQRVTPALQTASFSNNGPLPAKTIESALDRAMLAVQQSQIIAGRALQVPAADLMPPSGAAAVVLPPKALRISQVLGFDLSGNPALYAPGNGAAGSAANVFYIAPVSGAVSRTVAAKLAESTSVTDLGVVMNDATQATANLAKINQALVDDIALSVPAGTLYYAGALEVTQNGAVLLGAGVQATTLVCTSTTANAIEVQAVPQLTIGGFTLDRNVTAATGANGLAFVGQTTLETVLHDIVSQHHYYGFQLTNTAFSIGDRLTAQFNAADGFLITNGSYGPTMQWTLENCLAQFNGGWGYNVEAAVPAGNPAGPNFCTLDTWLYCSSFANGQGGIKLAGQSAASVCDFTLIGGWLGSDNGDLIYSDSYGFAHRIIATAMELAGTYSGTGPQQNQAARNFGSGINYTANNNDLTVTGGGHIRGNAQHGINAAAYQTNVDGATRIQLNGAGGAGYCGINVTSPGFLTVNGCPIGNTPAGGNQATGIAIWDGSKLSAFGNDLQLNTTHAILCTTNLAAAQLGGNIGFVAKYSGVTTIAAGTTALAIAHSLSAAPTIVQTSAAGSFGAVSFWTDTYTATTFTVHFSAATGATSYLAWTAMLSSFA